MGLFNWGNKSKSRSTLAPSRKDKPGTSWSDKQLEKERKRLQTLVDMGYSGKFGEEFKRDLKKVERIIEERELQKQKKWMKSRNGTSPRQQDKQKKIT